MSIAIFWCYLYLLIIYFSIWSKCRQASWGIRGGIYCWLIYRKKEWKKGYWHGWWRFWAFSCSTEKVTEYRSNTSYMVDPTVCLKKNGQREEWEVCEHFFFLFTLSLPFLSIASYSIIFFWSPMVQWRNFEMVLKYWL